ncbi:diguanylate cyclase [Arenimonas sp. MALMAid1274]|uniref:GGDEF domain-containing protein n=1 Tax=Arenimonas sp. MALMAid1274 TaxID=3411630 RepID=UPI003BA0B00A
MPLSLLPGHARRLARSSWVAGLAAVVVALAALAGWALDVEVLRTVLPGHAAMKANTAIGLMLAGLALAVLQLPAPWAPRLCVLLSCGVLALGVTTLLQYATGRDLGIDTLLFADPQAVAQGRLPGRMSQISAIGFLLLGWRGVRPRHSRERWLDQALALAVLAIALFALSAYGYAMGMGSREAPFNPISVHTAVLLLLLALGWLASQPEAGLLRIMLSDTFGAELARRTLLPALLVPVLLSYLAQLAHTRRLLSEGATITVLATSSGVAVAVMIWWASALLDRVERERRSARILRDSAHTDALTGLGNRRAFDAALAKLAQGLELQGRPYSLLLIDLDHFKQYNDSFGHPAGDEALRQTGQLLPLALRPGDLATRYGGEEFAVLLPGARRDDATTVAERIVHNIRSGLWLHRAVTASVGVAQARAGEPADALVQRADAALYAAKQAGRDRAMPAD